MKRENKKLKAAGGQWINCFISNGQVESRKVILRILISITELLLFFIIFLYNMSFLDSNEAWTTFIEINNLIKIWKNWFWGLEWKEVLCTIVLEETAKKNVLYIWAEVKAPSISLAWFLRTLGSQSFCFMNVPKK